jgi:hypothetical protein
MPERRRRVIGCRRFGIASRLAVLVLLLVAPPGSAPGSAADLAPEVTRALETSTYVYIASQRKDGSFGAPAEIWFMYDQGSVWVASPTTAWRVKRIRAGRAAARIAVGTKDGPTFTAIGSFVRDPAAYARLYSSFAAKYPEGWSKFEARFRDGLKDGSRVLMRYRPVAVAPSPSSSAIGTPEPSPRP